VQDDSRPPLPTIDLSWLVHPVLLFLRWPQVGAIGLSMGLFFVSHYAESLTRGHQTLSDLPDSRDHLPICSTDAVGTFPARDGEMGRNFVREGDGRVAPLVRTEAMRCADFGPLFVRRSAFFAVGGYNESGTRAGEPGSVRVDCELQARLWLAGRATLFVGLEETERWTHTEERRAWAHPLMMSGHARRQRDYFERFEREGIAARRTIDMAARVMNQHLKCPLPSAVAEVRRTGFMTMPLI